MGLFQRSALASRAARASERARRVIGELGLRAAELVDKPPAKAGESELIPGRLARRVYSPRSSIGEALAALREPQQNPVGLIVSCSHRHAGGGWLGGVMAQEEDVSRASSWALQAQEWEGREGFYGEQTGWGSSSVLLCEGCLLADELGEPIPPQPLLFAGVQAPNWSALPHSRTTRPGALDGVAQEIQARLATAFGALRAKGARQVIANPIGAGAFGVPERLCARAVAQAWHAQGAGMGLRFTCTQPERLSLFEQMIEEELQALER